MKAHMFAARTWYPDPGFQVRRFNLNKLFVNIELLRKMENKIEWKLNTVGSVHRIKSSGDVDIIKYISDDLSGG